MFWASVQTMFFNLISAFPNDISKQLFLKDHIWYACASSQGMTVCLSEHLQGCSGHWRAKKLFFLVLSGMQARSSCLDSKAKEQSEPAVVGMDFGLLLFQNWYSTSRALLPSASECVPGSLELHSDILWVFPFCLSRCLSWTLFLFHVMLYVGSGQHNVFKKDVIACHRVAGSPLFELGFGWRPLHNL